MFSPVDCSNCQRPLRLLSTIVLLDLAGTLVAISHNFFVFGYNFVSSALPLSSYQTLTLPPFFTAVIRLSKSLLSIPITTFPNISAAIDDSNHMQSVRFDDLLMPRPYDHSDLSSGTVSIIPGIQNFEPLRTETNNGFSKSSNFLPVFAANVFQ